MPGTSSLPPLSPELESSSQDELLACLRLLATSVADHRERFGNVPMDLTAKHAGGRGEAARAALEEALAQVRVDFAPAQEAHASTPEHEQRRQFRISLNAPLTVFDLARQRRAPAVLRNISWGGAALRCMNMPASPGEQVVVLLPVGGTQEIEVEATILRRTRVGESEEYGVRFERMDPADEPRFRRVLEVLLEKADGDGRRGEPRLVQRLEIEYGDRGELTATLEDISTGGLQLTVPDPLELQQSLLIALSCPDVPDAFELRARVVHQACVEEHGVVLYRVGLAFEHADPVLRERVADVIRRLAGRHPGHPVDGAPRLRA